LANVPSKEELISKLMFLLKYPMQSLASVADQIAKKVEPTGEIPTGGNGEVAPAKEESAPAPVAEQAEAPVAEVIETSPDDVAEEVVAPEESAPVAEETAPEATDAEAKTES
jgi:hypothetical protein